MENNYKQPEFKELNFHCPNCGVLAFQNWQFLYHNSQYFDDLDVAFCQNCGEYNLWKKRKMIYPKKLTAPLPHEDMPDSAKELYEEARNVSDDSPRAAAALLRVSLEKFSNRIDKVIMRAMLPLVMLTAISEYKRACSTYSNLRTFGFNPSGIQFLHFGFTDPFATL